MYMRNISVNGRAYEISEAYPATDVMPWAHDGDDFRELVESIRVGFDEARPIIRHADTGKLIGGRRRELACRVAGVQPVYRDVRWDDDEIIAYVEREDLHRRNISPTQRAAVVVSLAALRKHGVRYAKTEMSRDISAVEPFPVKELTLDEISKSAGTSRETAQRVSKVKKESPELMPSLIDGKLDAFTAAKAADLPKAARTRIAESDEPKATATAELKKVEAAKPAPEPEPEAPAEPTEEQLEAEAAKRIEDMDQKEFCKHVDSVCRELDKMNAKIKLLGNNKLFSPAMHWQSAIDQIKSARGSLFIGRPCYHCPYCEKKGAVSPTCTCCRGTNAISKIHYQHGLKATGVKS